MGSAMKPTTIIFAVSLTLLSACERKAVVIEVPSARPLAEPVARRKTAETVRVGEAVDAYDRFDRVAHVFGSTSGVACLAQSLLLFPSLFHQHLYACGLTWVAAEP
jgi:hypothetical protein